MSADTTIQPTQNQVKKSKKKKKAPKTDQEIFDYIVAFLKKATTKGDSVSGRFNWVLRAWENLERRGYDPAAFGLKLDDIIEDPTVEECKEYDAAMVMIKQNQTPPCKTINCPACFTKLVLYHNAWCAILCTQCQLEIENPSHVKFHKSEKCKYREF